jgi:hypothetical protein
MGSFFRLMTTAEKACIGKDKFNSSWGLAEALFISHSVVRNCEQ